MKPIIYYLRNRPKPASLNCHEVPRKIDVTNCCQGCSASYADRDVMIVDNVGPVCFNCLYNLAARFLS